jgi:REP element-mobilizing transposase RayT
LDDPVISGIISDVWLALPGWFPTIGLDEFVVMPNHVHLIVWLQHVGAGASPAPTIGADGIETTPSVDISEEEPNPVPAEGIVDPVGVGLAPTPTGKAPTPTGKAPTPIENASALSEIVASWIIPAPQATNLTPTLGEVIGAFKSLVFTVYLDWIEANDPIRQAKFWQRNYYEHIIRNQRELDAIRHYIRCNPIQWDLDRDNPNNSRSLQFPAEVEDYLADVWALTTDGAL